MKKLVPLVFGLGILAFAVNKYYLVPQAAAKKMAEAPPPPPPPPPEEAPPPPVLDAKAMEKIRLSTKDSNPEVRWEAVQFLIKAGVPEANQFLFDMLERDTEASLRLRAVDALKDRKGPKVSAALMHALKDSEADVRLAVLTALGQREDIDAAAAVSELVGDSDERVRLSAIQTLNLLNDKRQARVHEAADRNARAQQEYQEKMKQYEDAQQKAAQGGKH